MSPWPLSEKADLCIYVYIYLSVFDLHLFLSMDRWKRCDGDHKSTTHVTRTIIACRKKKLAIFKKSLNINNSCNSHNHGIDRKPECRATKWYQKKVFFDQKQSETDWVIGQYQFQVTSLSRMWSSHLLISRL